MRRSLRSQLLAWVLVPLLLLAALNGTASWISARDAADLVTDRMLAASARSIAEQAIVEEDLIAVVVPPAALEMFDTGSGDFVYYAVTDGAGRLLAGTADLPRWARDRTSGQPSSTEAVYRDRPLHLFALDHPIAGPGLEASVTVVLGTTLNSRDALLRHLWAVGFGQQLALIVTAGLFMILGLRMGLAPLLRLRDAVMARPGSSLEPLEAGAVQAELQPLVVALNQQLDRVQKQLAAQHRFVTNAAHQLRTPLALLNVQATYARRTLGSAEQDAALAAIQSGTQQLSRLSGQLLTLARAEPGSRRPRADRVDLGALAHRVLDDFAEAALAKGIDLGLEEQEGTTVRGDATMLGELLVNLVDNALRYCPSGSSVTVRVQRAGDDALVAVQDDGPGLPPSEWERVFERFYRAPDTPMEGSGLGLAIVQEVATAAGGRVLARAMDGGGLVVEVRLPAA
ncbi:sensor histidine kinase [Lichenifustis flavocetrariae]|uniref:histidine kinase n=1 Tax=Lichenifustis flavocetrariae TaxID=2949735 RepID=A0AA41YQZ9_9HYPH|nr:sensor histidine kinase [Lichenifustis flavocetrariae]MCW6506944.1 sensor histidine kinase [Lichenifustis flavocetrariae]